MVLSFIAICVVQITAILIHNIVTSNLRKMCRIPMDPEWCRLDLHFAIFQHLCQLFESYCDLFEEHILFVLQFASRRNTKNVICAVIPLKLRTQIVFHLRWAGFHCNFWWFLFKLVCKIHNVTDFFAERQSYCVKIGEFEIFLNDFSFTDYHYNQTSHVCNDIWNCNVIDFFKSAG